MTVGGSLQQLERAGELARQLGLSLTSLDGLAEALVHGSYLNENAGYHGQSNERLEFLGDAVIGLVVGDELFREFPGYPEGRLTALRANLVRGETLARVARRLSLGEYLLMGRGEDAAGSRERPAILAAVFEALVGALWLDQGYASSRERVLEWLQPEWEQIASGALEVDPKTRLQQVSQARQQGPPMYRLVSAEGPDHARTFTVEAVIGDAVAGRGTGRSKQAAEMEAAQAALASFQDGVSRVS